MLRYDISRRRVQRVIKSLVVPWTMPTHNHLYNVCTLVTVSFKSLTQNSQKAIQTKNMLRQLRKAARRVFESFFYILPDHTHKCNNSKCIIKDNENLLQSRNTKFMNIFTNENNLLYGSYGTLCHTTQRSIKCHHTVTVFTLVLLSVQQYSNYSITTVILINPLSTDVTYM